jgi:hypothetical protein
VFQELVNRSDGVFCTIQAYRLARILHLHPVTIYRSLAWLQAHNLLLVERRRGGNVYLFLIQVKPPVRRKPPSKLGQFTWKLRRAVKHGVLTQERADELRLNRAIAEERQKLARIPL